MASPERSPVVLAKSPCAEVQRWADGTFHLSVGPVTIRMEADVFRALCLTLTEATEASRVNVFAAPRHGMH